MRRWVGLLLLATTTGGLLGCGSLVSVSRDFNVTAPWADYQRIVISTRNGGVELAAAEVAEIEISGTKQAGGLTLAEAEENVEQVTIVAEPDPADPTTFRIEVEYPDFLRFRSVGVRFVVRVPEPCAAEISTGNGPIRVEHLEGTVALRTSNGRITVQDVVGDVSADTSNGCVDAARITGNLEVDTSNGDVEVIDIRGGVGVATSNGRIRVEAAPPDDASIVLGTSNGSIHVTVPATMKADLKLSTSNGHIYTEMDQVTLTNPRLSRRRVEAVMNGGGGGRIVARSSNGSVTLVCR